MEFRAMTEADLKIILEHSLYAQEPKNSMSDDAHAEFVLEHGDSILAAGGFRAITETTAEGWIMLTDYVGNHLIPVYKVISEWLEIWCKNHKIHRVQAWVKSGFEEGKRTVRHLGFTEEFKMLDFLGPGKDAYLYYRIMENK